MHYEQLHNINKSQVGASARTKWVAIAVYARESRSYLYFSAARSPSARTRLPSRAHSFSLSSDHSSLSPLEATRLAVSLVSESTTARVYRFLRLLPSHRLPPKPSPSPPSRRVYPDEAWTFALYARRISAHRSLYK